MVLPYLCLWRVEFDLAGASVLEPRQAEAGGRGGHEVTLAHKSRGHRSRSGLSVVGGDRVQGDRAADIHGERLRTLNRQPGRFVPHHVWVEAGLTTRAEIRHHHGLVD